MKPVSGKKQLSMAKRILITGGAGFIGSNITRKLISKGYEVVILDNLSVQIHGIDPENSVLYNSVKNDTTFIKGSVCDRDLLTKAIAGVDAIIHLAAETGTGQSMYEVYKYVDINVVGTALLLDILVNEKHTVKKVIIASSRSIYGEGKYHSSKYGTVYPGHRNNTDMMNGFFEVKYKDDDQLSLIATDEESKIHPSSVYGITKQNQEQMIMTVCPTIGIAPVAFRYQNVYGPGQSLSNPYTGILSIFSTQIRNGNDLNIFEDGLETRDFVYIDDVVDATIKGLEMPEADQKVFNVGSGVATTVKNVAETLIKSYGIGVKMNISGNFRLGDIRHNYADLGKINTTLGFTPAVSFEDGIKSFTDWVVKQDIQKSTYDSSIKEMKEKGLLK